MGHSATGAGKVFGLIPDRNAMDPATDDDEKSVRMVVVLEQLIVRILHPLVQAGSGAKIYLRVVGGRLVPVREGGPVAMENEPAQGEAQAGEDDPGRSQDQEGSGQWDKGRHEAKENRGDDDEDPFP